MNEWDSTLPTLRTLSLTLCALLAACANAPSGAPAQSAASAAPLASAGPAPGQWQLVLEVDGLPGSGKVAPQTMSMCSTAEDKKQWQEMVSGKAAAGCTVRDYAATGSTISYKMQCAGGIEGVTTIRIVDEDHYGGESRLTLQGGANAAAAIHSRVTATRLAPVCRK